VQARRAQALNRVRIGVDVGGTFTDIIVATGRALTQRKVPTEEGSGGAVVANLVSGLPPGTEIEAIVHGTTLVTNAVAERRGARTALITTQGFRDVLEIARQSREHLYSLRVPGRAAPLVPRRLRFEANERTTHTGEILTPLDETQLADLARHLHAAGVEAVAVCLLHSYANPAHEWRIREVLDRDQPYVSISSEINAEFREYERTSTVVLNAYVMPLTAQYIGGLERELDKRGISAALRLVQSNGGMMSCDVARRQPLRMLISGPAAGVAASRFLVSQLGIPTAVTLDMGGTTTDVCLVNNGVASVMSERKIAGLPARFPSIAVESIGAGGGSVAWVDRAGGLKVGPRSAGASPGPACYGLGGSDPTVTDANLILGYLGEEPLAGTIVLRRELSEKALGQLGRQFGFGPLEMAEGMIAVANANMLSALKLVSIQKGFDVRKFALVAYGGAGPIHAGRLARALGIPHVVIPAFSSVFSAFGCLVSDVRYDAVQTYHSSLRGLDTRRAAKLYAGMEEPLVHRLLGEGHASQQIRIERSMDLRYAGQNYEIEVPMPGDPDGAGLEKLRTEFDARHRALYSYATQEPVECVNLRVVVSVATEMALPVRVPADRAPARPSRTRKARFAESGEVAMPVFVRADVEGGGEIHGPAAVEDEWSTVIVYPGQRLKADSAGNLRLRVNP